MKGFWLRENKKYVEGENMKKRRHIYVCCVVFQEGDSGDGDGRRGFRTTTDS